jgi:uncharacterized membrane protein HdeD (DUF308 family)
LCVLGLVGSVVDLYSSRTLFNASRFADRVAASLEQPPIAHIVAEQVADQIIAVHRDLTAYRPLLIGSLETIVSSTPFRAAARRAARTTHEALLSASGDDLALNITDFGILAQTALSENPDIASRIPSTAHVAIRLTRDWPIEAKMASLLRRGHRMRMRALSSFIVALAAGLLGLSLARRKDEYLLRLGLGLVFLAFFVAGAAYFGDRIVARFATSAMGKDLVRGLWPVFVGPLAIRMIILGGLGVVLVAAVTSLLEKVSLSAIARGLFDVMLRKPQRARWAVLRGAVLTGAGLTVLFHPSDSLIILAVALGVAFLFAGIQELFTTMAMLSRRLGPQTADALPGRDAWSMMASVALVAVLLLVGGTWWLGRIDRAGPDVQGFTGSCNGDPSLCGRRLDRVAFAATHNSMSAADQDGWMFPNQERNIRTQLDDGIRGFLIDVHYGAPVAERVKTLLEDETAARMKYEAVLGKEGVDAAMRIRDRLIGQEEGPRDVFCCHGFCELGHLRFTQVLTTMRDFLITHPGEVLILILQDEGVTPTDVQNAFADSGLDRFVYHGPAKPPWPTLRRLVDRDERVLVFTEHDASGVPWIHQAFEVFQETPYRFLNPDEFSNQPGRGGTEGSLLLLNHWIETAPAPRPSNAEIVNAYDVLYGRANACRRERGMMPTLVAVDFYRTGDLFRVVRTLNGLPPLPATVLP